MSFIGSRSYLSLIVLATLHFKKIYNEVFVDQCTSIILLFVFKFLRASHECFLENFENFPSQYLVARVAPLFCYFRSYDELDDVCLLKTKLQLLVNSVELCGQTSSYICIFSIKSLFESFFCLS